jgi:hypothetical protein
MKFLKLKTIIIVALVVVVSLALGGVVDTAIQNGADRLVFLQNFDGGWDWPLEDPNPLKPSPTNTIGPIGMGLAKVYGKMRFDDNDYYEALQRAGDFLLAKTNNFSPPDGYLAAELDKFFEGNKYKEHVQKYFYQELKEGTYNRKGLGVLYDTAGYVNSIREARFSQGIANLAAWDVGMGLVGAASSGADISAWVEGVKAEIDELVGGAFYDVIGLAGAIYGLAFVDEDHDPQGGEHESVSSLRDLADILIMYQIEMGGFSYSADYLSPGQDNETIQETSYAILALNEFDCSNYMPKISGAVDYLLSVQLSNGGWKNWAGGGENNEITAEALWAICNWNACVVDVNIDIKPGSDPNCFNIDGHGNIPVAILGSANFDVRDIDVDTLDFAGMDVSVRGKGRPQCSIEDSNGDSFPDLVCHFEDDSTTWNGGTSTATVTGGLVDGLLFEGTDSICIVGKIIPCDLLGNWQLSYLQLPPGQGTYDHDMIIITQSPDGSFSGTGHYPTGPLWTWKVTGTLTSTVSMTITYDQTVGGTNPYIVSLTGTVEACRSSMSGTATDNKGYSYTWTATHK